MKHYSPLDPPRMLTGHVWSGLYDSAPALALSHYHRAHPAVSLIVVENAHEANELEHELAFYGGSHLSLLTLHGWETLPYDAFSPDQGLLSERIKTLSSLHHLTEGVIIATLPTLMHRVAPPEFIQGSAFDFTVGDTLHREAFRTQLITLGYRAVEQVMERGEFCVRGGLIDLFPMASEHAVRIELVGNNIESLRFFNSETQRTLAMTQQLTLLPAREFPLTPESIRLFKEQWRAHFSGNPSQIPFYQSVIKQEHAPGAEYYLSLFFKSTGTVFDYLPKNCQIVRIGKLDHIGDTFWHQVENRYEALRYDVSRPLLPPAEVFLKPDAVFSHMKAFLQIRLEASEKKQAHHFGTQPAFTRSDHNNIRNATAVVQALESLRSDSDKRILVVAETPGRKEILLELLHPLKITSYDSWDTFLTGKAQLGITVFPIERGLSLPHYEVVTENQLLGHQVFSRQKRVSKNRSADHVIKSLAELQVGSTVVHADHGIGRYTGLQTIQTGEIIDDYLCLEYQNNDKLYVPVSQLHLISRYQTQEGVSVTLDHLGSSHWQKVKRKALEKIKDVAAQLLALYAKRAHKPGFTFPKPEKEYEAFIQQFPFEETPDQAKAIEEVIEDMTSPHPMDRLICGDVGFGKTEVALRAAFIAVMGHKQVCVLAPTTLLADQHYHAFKSRFADWPITIDFLSRFKTSKEQKAVIAKVEAGKVDILIATHTLFYKDLKYNNLGLLIIDEEHKFGVQHKEKIKALRSEVDILTLTATPIPRTLNMGLSGIKSISLIMTPPQKRLPVKTFLLPFNETIIKEAISRELLRGGQVYFLHNEVKTLSYMEHLLRELMPHALLATAHGQMEESQLENIMSDFYHKRVQILLCTTIIESGLDIPSANTILINRADKLGLAQLHQLRGRVGRSHHQAYAYLLTPDTKLMTQDAKKRLEAIVSLGDLGAGFQLASSDLEIRGAGELLGEEQSGYMDQIGFGLYMEMLARIVEEMKMGNSVDDFNELLTPKVVIELPLTAIIPEKYIPDVTIRLSFYKRLADALHPQELEDLMVELIDRFGLLPQETRNLIQLNRLKMIAQAVDIVKIAGTDQTITLTFKEKPLFSIEKLAGLIQKEPKTFKLLPGGKLQHTSEIPVLEHLEKVLNQLKTRLLL